MSFAISACLFRILSQACALPFFEIDHVFGEIRSKSSSSTKATWSELLSGIVLIFFFCVPLSVEFLFDTVEVLRLEMDDLLRHALEPG